VRESARSGLLDINQQVVKNVWRPRASATVFQKLREAALAYHLERSGPRARSHAVPEHLYFGNGA